VIKYSLCHASYRDGSNSIRIRDTWLRNSKFPSRVRHYLGFERGDYGVANAYNVDPFMSFGMSADGLTLFATTHSDNTVSAVRNWNAAASLAKEEFLIAIADDLVPCKDWDIKLDDILSGQLGKPRILTFTDDRCISLRTLGADTLLPRHPGITREAYVEFGFLFSPDYESVGPDLEVLIESLNRGWLIDARSIKFHHSFNQVIDSNSDLVCGCAGESIDTTRGASQKMIHRDSIKAKKLLKERWGGAWMMVAKLACANRFADFIYASMRMDTKNRPTTLLALFNYYFWISGAKRRLINK